MDSETYPWAQAWSGQSLVFHVYDAYVRIVREHVAMGADELPGLLATRLGRKRDDPEVLAQVAEAQTWMLADPAAPVLMAAPDVLVHAPILFGNAVLTRRLSVTEHTSGYLELDNDLAGFLRCHPARVAAGQLYVDDPMPGEPVMWNGPYNWLAALPLDALLAVRATEDGEVSIVALDAEPAAAPELVTLLRTVYDGAGTSGLPVSAETLVLGMLRRDRSAFASPRPPLTELAAAAGLERRGSEFAHDAQVWERAGEVRRQLRLMKRLGSGTQGVDAVKADELLRRPGDPEALRQALDLLADPEIADTVAEELLGDDDPERVAQLVALADRLVAVAVAGRPVRVAVARWFAAVAAERAGRVLDAERHLRSASRDAPGWSLVEDGLAWCEFDRGDTAAALARWRALGVPDDELDVATALPWLPERADRLAGKAKSYLRRRSGKAERDLEAFAEECVADLDEALEAPLFLDVVLHEGGWFERFLAERGPLLPADEAQLAACWVQVRRSAYEVVEVGRGAGVTVRDLRTEERIEVTGRADGQTFRVGELLCARAVPDGAGRQLLSAVVAVPPGRKRQLLRVLRRGDGPGLLAWLAAVTGPPEALVDGEPPVHCTAVLRFVGDAAAALDEWYLPSDLGWIWIGQGEQVLGLVQLDGIELTAFADTEARMEQLLDDLREALPGYELVSEDRRPMRPRSPAKAVAPPADLQGPAC